MLYTASLPFGKHEGKPLSQVPTGYLKWALAECDSLEAWLREQVRQEVARRGVRFLPAEAVLCDLEDMLNARVSEDEKLSSKVAGRITDHLLDAFDALREAHGIGAETQLVTAGPPRRTFDELERARA